MCILGAIGAKRGAQIARSAPGWSYDLDSETLAQPAPSEKPAETPLANADEPTSVQSVHAVLAAELGVVDAFRHDLADEPLSLGRALLLHSTWRRVLSADSLVLVVRSAITNEPDEPIDWKRILDGWVVEVLKQAGARDAEVFNSVSLLRALAIAR